MGDAKIGSRLRKAREDKRLTQKQVAEKIGIHNTTLGKYELGEREPDFETLKKLAEIYEVSPVWLVTGEHQKSRADAQHNSAETTIKLIEEEARKLGMAPSDPEFQKMLSHAFDLLRMARGQNDK